MGLLGINDLPGAANQRKWLILSGQPAAHSTKCGGNGAGAKEFIRRNWQGIRAEAAAWDSNPDLRLRNGRKLSVTLTAHNDEQAPHQITDASGHDTNASACGSRNPRYGLPSPRPNFPALADQRPVAHFHRIRESWMTGDALQWFGIAVGVVLFITGLFLAVKVWRNRQNQRVDRGGLGIQAGNNVNISGRDSRNEERR